MRSLFIMPSAPRSDRKDRNGEAHRVGLFLRALSHVSSSIHIAHFAPPAACESYGDAHALSELVSDYWGLPVTASMIPMGIRTETFRSHYVNGVFDPAALVTMYRQCGSGQIAIVRDLIGKHGDLVVARRLATMLPVVRSGVRPRHMFFDMDDIDYILHLRSTLKRPLTPGRLLYALQTPALFLAMRKAIAFADLSFVCSEEDRRRVVPLSLGRKLRIVPNAMDLDVPSTPLPDAPNLLFIGTLYYPPNADAVDRLAFRILPMIRRAVPGAKLFIVGTGAEHTKAHDAKPEGVVFTGFVPNLDDVYAETRVVCCPISNGSGTRLKLIEAAAYARPIVSTQLGAEGLGFTDGTEAILRDDDAGFAAACVDLLTDSARAARLGDAARRLVRARYSPASVIEQIEAMLTDVMPTAAGAGLRNGEQAQGIGNPSHE